MLILEYVSTHGTPEWCAARMSARESKGPLPAYEQLCASCTGVCGSVLHGPGLGPRAGPARSPWAGPGRA